MMRSNIPIAVPIDEQAARRRAAYTAPAAERDLTLWAGVLFWFGFAAIAVIAGL